MLRRALLLWIAASASLLTTPSWGVAAEYSANGMLCRIHGYPDGSETFDARGMNWYPWSQEPTMVFVCPIIRRGLGENTITNINVRVQDSNSSEKLSCYVRSCDRFGNGCWNSTNWETTTQGAINLPIGDVATYSNGHAYVRCIVPGETAAGARSGILSYVWTD